MAFVFDNLIAILVGTTLLVALVLGQQRGQQGTAEAAVRDQPQAAGSLDGIQRAVETMRVMSEMEAAHVTYGGMPTGGTGTLRAWTTTPCYQHAHAFDQPTATAPHGSRVYHLEGGAAERHENPARFHDLLQQLGSEPAYLDFGNVHNHGSVRVHVDADGVGPFVASAQNSPLAHPDRPGGPTGAGGPPCPDATPASPRRW